jgi:Tfp pilus assembly protein PilF
MAMFMVVETSSICPAASDEVEVGLQSLKAGQLQRAINFWSVAIRKNPKSYAAYVNRGTAYMQCGYVFRGIADWHKARKFSPVFAYGVFTGGYIRQASGNALMLNYAASLELDPDHIPSVAMMGITYLDLGLREKAVELYRKSVDLTKNPLRKSRLEHWVESLEP